MTLQLRLGCVELENPGLVDAAYNRFTNKILEQIQQANTPNNNNTNNHNPYKEFLENLQKDIFKFMFKPTTGIAEVYTFLAKVNLKIKNILNEN